MPLPFFTSKKAAFRHMEPIYESRFELLFGNDAKVEVEESLVRFTLSDGKLKAFFTSQAGTLRDFIDTMSKKSTSLLRYHDPKGIVTDEILMSIQYENFYIVGDYESSDLLKIEIIYTSRIKS